MNKLLIYILSSLIFLSAYNAEAQNAEKPHLLVGIKIDGLQVNQLNEWSKNFTVGGFRKLMNEALFFENIEHNIVSAGNAAELTTVFTGTYPFYHSITANTYFDRKQNKLLSIYNDNKEQGIGTSQQLSPHNILTTTLADEIKLNNPQSKLHVVALDAESAISMGGHLANSVTWIDRSNNRWATSTFYHDGLSKWADLMNIGNAFKKSSNNELVKELTLTILNNELNNNRQATNALFIQFSLNGEHSRSPNKSILDAYIQVDNILQDLFYEINNRFGEKNVLFFIIGNTGATHQPTDLMNNRIEAGFFNTDRSLALLNTYLMAIYGQANWISGYYGKNIYLNRNLIEEKKIDLLEIQQKVADFMLEFEGVHDAYLLNDIRLHTGVKDPRYKYHNSYYKRTAGDVMLVLKPGWLEVDNDKRQVDSSNSPIMHIPFFMMGSQIEAQVNREAYEMIDIAPTLSEFLNIPTPNAALGKAIKW